MEIKELISRWDSRSAEDLAARASEHLPFWVSLGLVIMIGYYLARLAWLLVPAGTEIDWTPPAIAGSGGQGVEADGSDYRAVVTAHLFGQADRQAEPVAGDALDAPDTRLNLKLRATVADQRNDLAHAIIADGTGAEKVYFIGDSVPGGATLQQVHPDRVILNRGGVLEALRLPRVSEGDSGAALRAARPARSSAGAAAPTVQEVISQNAATFTQIIRPQPYMPGGQLKGYRVYPGRQRQQFTALGLRPGDLVTGINGTPLNNNPAQGMEIFRSLGDSSQVTVTIERNGETQTLTLDTSQLETGDGARQ